MLKNHNEAVRTADRLVRKYGTRDADQLAEALGLIVMPRAFKHQKGVYKVIERNRYIFIKQDLHPVMHNIVLLHEIGHDQLHRSAAIAAGGFQEFNLFNMADRAMEYEANCSPHRSRCPTRKSSSISCAAATSRRSHS